MSCDIDTISAAEKDICYMSGTEININGGLVVKDQNGDPVNLAGVEMEMHVKRRRTDSTVKALIAFKTSDGTLVLSGVDNNVVTPQGVYQMDQDTYYHDLLRLDIPEYVIKGKFLVDGNVTRP